MKLISEVVKKVESERSEIKVQTSEDVIPVLPKKRRRVLPLILFLIVFLMLGAAGYFVWNIKFKNSSPTIAKPKANLAERMKNVRSKSLAQTSSDQNALQTDSMVQASVEEKVDSSAISGPALVEKESNLAEKKEVLKTENKSSLKTDKPVAQIPSTKIEMKSDISAKTSKKEKLNPPEVVASTPAQKFQDVKKIESQSEKMISQKEEKISTSANTEIKSPAPKAENKLPKAKISLPDKLVLSTPSSEMNSKTENKVSVQDNSQLVKNYFDFGLSSQRSGKPKEAEECYLKALALDSSFYPARLNLSTVYLEEGKMFEAENELNNLINKRPGDPKVLYNTAFLYQRKNEFEKADEILNRLFIADPKNSNAYLLKGKNLEVQNKISEAIKNYIEAYQINPNDPKILYSLGRAKDLAGEKNEAVTYYQLFLKNSSEKNSDLIRSVSQRVSFLKSTGGKND
ncbi:MAG: tetratricopeptide repeat protein [candidate division Zixibacteria bacterium]|nr:tetratricopeptide repeat protein [candidate division Zixibacteria bacterium]